MYKTVSSIHGKSSGCEWSPRTATNKKVDARLIVRQHPLGLSEPYQPHEFRPIYTNPIVVR